MRIDTRPPARYVVNPSTLDNRLRAAYAVAGLPVPSVLAHVEDALRTEPTPQALAAELVPQAVGHPDPAAWTEDALQRMARAVAAETLRAEVARHRDAVVKRHTARIAAQAAEDLRPTFDKTAAALVKVAAKLPPAAPLDLSAVYDADATKEHRAAVEALATLGRIASVHVPRPVSGRVSVDLSRLVLVLDVPQVGAAQPIDRLTREPLGDVDPRRAQVIELDRCAQDDGVDVALVRVARGDWPALSLSLARDAAEVARRTAYAEAAAAVVVSETGGRARRLAVRT